MRTLPIQIDEAFQGSVPPRPKELRKFDSVDGTYNNEAARRLEEGKTIVVGGLSLIGEAGCIVPTIGIMRLGARSPTGFDIRGWSLHVGHPDEKFRLLRHFNTERSVEDVLLPEPNCMTYFACEADDALAEEDADETVLAQIVRFVAVFISDEGPPEKIDW